MSIERRTTIFGITTKRKRLDVGASESFSAGKKRKTRSKIKVASPDEIHRYHIGRDESQPILAEKVFDKNINKNPFLKSGRIWQRKEYHWTPSK